MKHRNTWVAIALLPIALLLWSPQCGADIDAARAQLESALQAARDTATSREQAFVAARDSARITLARERGRLTTLESRHRNLAAAIADAQLRLERARQRTRDNSRDLDDLFESARFETRQLRSMLASSPLNAQSPDRLDTLATLGDSRGPWSPTQFESLWLTMLAELTQQGGVRRFDAAQSDSNAGAQRVPVTRIGTFALYGDAGVLTATGAHGVSPVNALPAGIVTRAAAVHRHPGGLADVLIDPTHGQLMTRLAGRASATDLFVAGGPIGIIIVTLGAAGLVLAAWRYAMLGMAARQMRLTAAGLAANDNALRRLQAHYDRHLQESTDDLRLALDDCVVDEATGFERGLSLLRLIAALAPLLGLLGTVTAMIGMFHVIETIGSGSPAYTAGAVSLALVTTALGLAVAVPVALAHALVAARSRTLIGTVEAKMSSLLAAQRAAGPTTVVDAR